MRVRRMGRTGLQVSEVCLGTMTFGNQCDRATSFRIMDVADAAGVDFFDTADVYPLGGGPETRGASEDIVGQWLHERRARDRIVLATKCRGAMGPRPNDQGLSRRHIIAACEDSLRRLRTDHVDALLLHWPTRSVPIEETMRAFERVLREGLARYVGVSNFQRAGMAAADAAAAGTAPLAFHEVRYGLDERRAERFAIPDAGAHGRVLLAYSPLGHGRLTRAPGAVVLRELADRRAVSPERMALAWSVARPGVVAIPKAARASHVRDNAAAGDLVLDGAEVARLEAAFPLKGGELPSVMPPYEAFHRLVLWGLRRRFGRGEGSAGAGA